MSFLGRFYQFHKAPFCSTIINWFISFVPKIYWSKWCKYNFQCPLISLPLPIKTRSISFVSLILSRLFVGPSVPIFFGFSLSAPSSFMSAFRSSSSVVGPLSSGSSRCSGSSARGECGAKGRNGRKGWSEGKVPWELGGIETSGSRGDRGGGGGLGG